MKRATGQWLTAAEDDLSVIERIAADDDLTHMVAFHCQQCVEKCFKAVLEEHSRKVPKEHSTLKLYGLVHDFISLHLDADILTDLDDLYIHARYPGELGLLPNGKPTVADARWFHEAARGIHEQIKQTLGGAAGR